MSRRARVIGLGQAAAGDDGAGLAVLEWLRERGVPDGVELVRASEDSALVDLLTTPVPVVVVDAVLGDPAGEVFELTPEEVASRDLHPVSTHGMGVARAVELARVLAPESVSPSIQIVAVTIVPPRRYAQRLSPAVAAAVPRAAARVLALVGGLEGE
jgi:hydrogenase maturation protease